jgi:hypothetical protein
MSIINLAGPLPRITLPSKLANGDIAPYSKDPYLDDSGISIWGSGTNAKRLKDIGISYATGVIAQVAIRQSIQGTIRAPCKAYAEITKLNAPIVLWLASSGNFETISEPGVYIAERDATNNLLGFSTSDSFFINDPYFKSLPIGPLPVLANVGNEAWCTGDTPASCIKLENGTIAVAMTSGGNLSWKSAWAQSNAVLVEIDVQYVPQGGILRVIELSGTSVLDITAPGKYSAEVTMNPGQQLSVVYGSNVFGSVIINSFKARRLTQTWTCEGPIFFQATALWGAPSYDFDRILNPQTIQMATSFERPSMQGWNPSPFEPVLGYGQAPPPSGYFRVGDTIRNNCAIAGSVSGWRCIAAGNPGTWMPLATL